nr:polymer-forming cytoskeletal protein [candidate division Zixibacteria bacterium]
MKSFRKRHIRACSIFLFLILFVGLPSLTLASRFLSSSGNLVSKNEMIDDDAYSVGDFVEIYGVVNGDLSAFCYEIDTDGEINGNVNVFAYRSYIGGKTERTVRLFAYEGEILGQAGSNVVAFCKDLIIGDKAVIMRDLNFAGENIRIDGNIKGNVDINADAVRISGVIEGDVHIEAQDVIILSSAVIKGNLDYTSTLEADISPEAVIEGKIYWEEKERKPDSENGLNILSRLSRFILFFMALITGFGLILMFNNHTRESSEFIEKRFWYSLAVGILAFLIFTVGALILMVLVIGIPLAIILMAMGVFLFYVGKIYVSIVIGRLVFRLLARGRKIAMGWELLIGLLLMTIVFQIPMIGTVIYVLTFIAGTGAAVAGHLSLNRKCRVAMAGITSDKPQKV